MPQNIIFFKPRNFDTPNIECFTISVTIAYMAFRLEIVVKLFNEIASCMRTICFLMLGEDSLQIREKNSILNILLPF